MKWEKSKYAKKWTSSCGSAYIAKSRDTSGSASEYKLTVLTPPQMVMDHIATLGQAKKIAEDRIKEEEK